MLKGTLYHMVLVNDETLISVKLERSGVIEKVDGDTATLPFLKAGIPWAMARMQATKAGAKVIANQWQAPHVECKELKTGWKVSVRAVHEYAGKAELAVSAPTRAEAVALFWPAWNETCGDYGVHTHLVWPGGYKVC